MLAVYTQPLGGAQFQNDVLTLLRPLIRMRGVPL